jgi:hypothetical protein
MRSSIKGAIMKEDNKRWAGLLVLLLACFSAGCAATTINTILAEPQRYNNREVTLKGGVVRSASVLGHGAYELDDGTGRIWVVSKHGVPRRGAQVKTKGKVRDVVDLGQVLELPREVGSGLVLLEREHSAAR